MDQFNADHSAVSARGLQLCITGDSEFDEGVIHESIKERATRGITNWIDFIDYNRQSLDGNLDEMLVERITAVYEAYDIPVIILKYGSKLQKVFRAGSAGKELRRRIDSLSTEDYQALLRKPPRVIRRVMTLARPDFEAFLYEGVTVLMVLWLTVKSEEVARIPKLRAFLPKRPISRSRKSSLTWVDMIFRCSFLR